VNKNLCKRGSTCRLCESGDVELVLSLTSTPPANAFVTIEKLNIKQNVFPLEVFICMNCSHIQLLDVIDPSYLFENYVYVSGTSSVFIRHFEDYAATISDRISVNSSGKLVVDIGSNDGTLLAKFKNRGFRVLGIDPARGIAGEASARGIETKVAFFTSLLAQDIRESMGPAQIVCANNVFAHADDLIDITKGVRTLLAPDGLFVFEVSYLVDVLQKTLFDTIYHEHLAYHSVSPLKRFFLSQGLEFVGVQRVDAHGGSLRGIVQLFGGPHKVEPSIDAAVILEESLNLDKIETFQRFAKDIDECKAKLLSYVMEAKSLGKSIAGFGAPAKATTLMYHFGLGPEEIDFIVDDSPLKQGMYTPGIHIPVLQSKALYRKKPDIVLILAWNFAESIMKKHKEFLNQGGEFLVPLPYFQRFN